MAVGKVKWNTFKSYTQPIREEIRRLLLRGRFSGNAKLIGFCEELYQPPRITAARCRRYIFQQVVSRLGANCAAVVGASRG